MEERSSPPLSGLRVLDLSTLLPGPLCSLHLADIGAEVIKVEHPVALDGTRRVGPMLESTKGSMSACFYLLNRNKKSITLNYRRAEGQEILRRLLASADILIEGFRPGAMNEMGLGYESLHAVYPRLIYCSISGYGATGPFRSRAGHDANYLAESGVLGLTGTEADPVLPGVQIADIAGGSMLALSGILAALYARERNGQGQFVDSGMMDGAFSLLPLQAAEFIGTGLNPERARLPLSGLLPNYQVYRCGGGRHVVLAALEGPFFRHFLRSIDREDLFELSTSGHYSKVRSELSQFFRSRSFEDLTALFSDTEACLSPVLTLEEAFCSPQLLERGSIIEIEDGRFGRLRLPGSPFHFSEFRRPDGSPAPEPGEHTSEVLSSLGIKGPDLESLQSRRII